MWCRLCSKLTEDAEQAGKLCDLTANPVDAKLNVAGNYNQHVEIVIGPNNQTMYTVDAPKLAVAVADEAPFKLRIEQPKAPLVQGGQMNLKVIAERKTGFKGAISVRMLFNPPGVGSSPAVDMPPDKNRDRLSHQRQRWGSDSQMEDLCAGRF